MTRAQLNVALEDAFDECLPETLAGELTSEAVSDLATLFNYVLAKARLQAPDYEMRRIARRASHPSVASR